MGAGWSECEGWISRLAIHAERICNSVDFRIVAATDTFVAYQPILEDEILPQAEDLYQAMARLANH